jgi:hypothetical protein
VLTVLVVFLGMRLALFLTHPSGAMVSYHVQAYASNGNALGEWRGFSLTSGVEGCSFVDGKTGRWTTVHSPYLVIERADDRGGL